MKALTAIQISILLRLKAKDETVNYTVNPEDLKVLYDMRLIITHLSLMQWILSQQGQKMVDKVLSLFDPTVMELSKSQYNAMPSEKTMT